MANLVGTKSIEQTNRLENPDLPQQHWKTLTFISGRLIWDRTKVITP